MSYLLKAGLELMTLIEGLPFNWYPEIFGGELTGYLVRRFKFKELE